MAYCLHRADGGIVKFQGSVLLTKDDSTTVEIWSGGVSPELMAVVRLGPGDSVSKESK